MNNDDMIEKDQKVKEDKNAIWWRGLYMLLFAVLYSAAKAVVVVVVVFQFFYVVIKGKQNEQLLKFGKALGQYIYEILLFLTFNREEHPFPMSPWPKVD